jgi:pimeloyl-ACP methyl ester carboxylesterase
MLHLRRSGQQQQPAILFLHAIGTNGWMWEDQFLRLEGFRCIAPDLPGHGLSRSIAWRSLEDTADLVADVIRREIGRQVHIVGLSLGAYVGLTLLSRHQELVDRAVLSGLNVLPLPYKRLMIISAWMAAPLLKLPLSARINARALKIPAEHVEAYSQSMRPLSLHSFLAASGDAIRFTVPQNASEITNPTLLIAGEREHAFIHRSIAMLHDVLPNARKRIAEGVGHGWCGEAPRLFADTVGSWCQGHELPSELLEPET